MTVLSLLPPPLADIALTHSLHHDRFIEFMAISVIESIKLILRGVAFKMGVVLEVGVVRLRGKKEPPLLGSTIPWTGPGFWTGLDSGLDSWIMAQFSIL